MKKTILFSMFAASVLLASCGSEKPEVISGETGQMNMTISFQGTKSPDTYADNSTFIPPTDWSNVKRLQIFLYNTSGVVQFSDIITPTGTTPYNYTANNVPVGVYTVKLVANAVSHSVDGSTALDAVQTSLDNGATFTQFTPTNVRTKDIGNFIIKHKPAAALSWGPVQSGVTYNYFQPISEVFVATSNPITITAGVTNKDLTVTGIQGAMQLKRDVSLMRVRINPTPVEAGTMNNDVTFAHADGALLIYRIPDKMNVKTGPVYSASTATNIVVAGASNVWESSNTGIAVGAYKFYKDVIVMPTYGAESPVQSQSYQYFVVVSGHADAGHVFSDGVRVAPAGGCRVFWYGIVEANFVPNTIREVNCILKSSGTPDIPIGPTEIGKLEIDVLKPLDWDLNIQITDIEM